MLSKWMLMWEGTTCFDFDIEQEKRRGIIMGKINLGRE